MTTGGGATYPGSTPEPEALTAMFSIESVVYVLVQCKVFYPCAHIPVHIVTVPLSCSSLIPSSETAGFASLKRQKVIIQLPINLIVFLCPFV